MVRTEIDKNKKYLLLEIVEYMEKAGVSKTILRKLTGNVTISAIDIGEGISEKISPFDMFIQIIDGKAEVIIEGVSKTLSIGDGIIIPAHKSNSIKANERFKMITTLIKSGYE